jgi:hypothetical protein
MWFGGPPLAPGYFSLTTTAPTGIAAARARNAGQADGFARTRMDSWWCSTRGCPGREKPTSPFGIAAFVSTPSGVKSIGRP